MKSARKPRSPHRIAVGRCSGMALAMTSPSMDSGTPRAKRAGDVLMSLGTLAVLVLVIVAADPRVRDVIRQRVGTPALASSEMTSASARTRGMVRYVVHLAQDQSQRNAPLMIFLAAASMLTAFMIRT
jgi:hypothetical protein